MGVGEKIGKLAPAARESRVGELAELSAKTPGLKPQDLCFTASLARRGRCAKSQSHSA